MRAIPPGIVEIARMAGSYKYYSAKVATTKDLLALTAARFIPCEL